VTFWDFLWRASAIGLGLAFGLLGFAVLGAWLGRHGLLDAKPPRYNSEADRVNSFFDQVAASHRLLRRRPTTRCQRANETNRSLS
jgi:hypothetical protein